MLHVTNGDSAADTIRQTGIVGPVLPWRDVLHEGPVPAGLTLEAMSTVRARFHGVALDEFRQRDETLKAGLTKEEIVLWFEADLYDQLQIIQVLDWIGRQPHRPVVSMICIGEYPGINGFQGIGQLTVAQMAGLFPARRVVSRQQIELAREAWQAFTAPDPALLNRMVLHETAALPFLGEAVLRLLELYPLTTNGLDRSERQVLQVLRPGPMAFSDLFPRAQALEERPFMGDSTLWDRILRIAHGPAPAVTLDESVLSLTAFGRECLDGTADFIAHNGIDRWIGGVHLTTASRWRWDPRARQVG